MGFLSYGTAVIEYDDRTLAHLQIVIATKLRPRESFMMSWRNAADVGDGRGAVWVEPSIPLYFNFDGSRPPTIDREWVERLAVMASSSAGLHVVDQTGDKVLARAFPPSSAREHIARVAR